MLIIFSDSSCLVPEHFRGNFFSIDRGDSLETLIDAKGIKSKYLDGLCVDYLIDNSTLTESLGRFNAKVLFYDR